MKATVQPQSHSGSGRSKVRGNGRGNGKEQPDFMPQVFSAVSNRGKVLNPDDIIPMDEDGFKEF